MHLLMKLHGKYHNREVDRHKIIQVLEGLQIIRVGEALNLLGLEIVDLLLVLAMDLAVDRLRILDLVVDYQ